MLIAQLNHDLLLYLTLGSPQIQLCARNLCYLILLKSCNLFHYIIKTKLDKQEGHVCLHMKLNLWPFCLSSGK